MQKRDIRFIVNEETLAGSILFKDEENIHSNFVFFHGGLGNKERILSVIPPIVDKGAKVLAIDFSGHGVSTGQLKNGSLKKRTDEARAAIDKFSNKDIPLIICGASMGGYTSIKMLEYYNIHSLILFCPALYDRNAYAIQFDAGFTEIIRQQYSWRNTDVLHSLENFKGNLLVIMGEQDEIIPPEVIELIMRHTPNVTKKELYVIPRCTHKIFNWLVENECELKQVQQKVLEYF